MSEEEEQQPVVKDLLEKCKKNQVVVLFFGDDKAALVDISKLRLIQDVNVKNKRGSLKKALEAALKWRERGRREEESQAGFSEFENVEGSHLDDEDEFPFFENIDLQDGEDESGRNGKDFHVKVREPKKKEEDSSRHAQVSDKSIDEFDFLSAPLEVQELGNKKVENYASGNIFSENEVTEKSLAKRRDLLERKDYEFQSPNKIVEALHRQLDFTENSEIGPGKFSNAGTPLKQGQEITHYFWKANEEIQNNDILGDLVSVPVDRLLANSVDFGTPVKPIVNSDNRNKERKEDEIECESREERKTKANQKAGKEVRNKRNKKAGKSKSVYDSDDSALSFSESEEYVSKKPRKRNSERRKNRNCLREEREQDLSSKRAEKLKRRHVSDRELEALSEKETPRRKTFSEDSFDYSTQTKVKKRKKEDNEENKHEKSYEQVFEGKSNKNGIGKLKKIKEELDMDFESFIGAETKIFVDKIVEKVKNEAEENHKASMAKK